MISHRATIIKATHGALRDASDPDPVKLRDRGLARLLKKEAGQINRDAIDRKVESSDTSETHNIIAYLAKPHAKSSQQGGHAGHAYTLAQALEFIDLPSRKQ